MAIAWFSQFIAWFRRLIRRLGRHASTADPLTLSIQCGRDIRRQVTTARDSTLLAEHQCGDLSSKLLKAIGNIQELVLQFEASSATTFQPVLQDFHRIAEKSRSLVSNCCARATNWCRAAVFQIQNEEAFREILLEVGLCYNVIYEQAKAMSEAEGHSLEVDDLRKGSTFAPTSLSQVAEDRKTLCSRLEDLANKSGSSFDHILARYLLSRLRESISPKRMMEDACTMYDASILRVTETELNDTWDTINYLGSSTFCVFRTKWLGIPCAKKVFPREENDSIFRKEAALFRKEAALLASLNHPNIVKFFCCGRAMEDEYRDSCFIAMELMEMSLDGLIKDRVKRNLGRFPMAVALDIIMQIARGMLYLHDLGIAHRDLKPQNVVVSRLPNNNTFCVKLLDFGMSRTKIQMSQSNTVSSKNIGTTWYRAPEAFSGAVDHSSAAHGYGWKDVHQKVEWSKADVYSFAVTCSQILSLEQPYAKAGTGDQLYEKLKTGTRPELPADCPETLSKLLKECWDGERNARPKFSNICQRLEKLKHDQLVKGPVVTTIAATESSITQAPQAADERGDGVDVPSSYKYIEKMLSDHSQLRTPEKHALAPLVESEDEAAANDRSDDEYESFEAPTTEGMDLERISLQKKTFIVSKVQGVGVDETMKEMLKKACEDFCKGIDLTRISTIQERGQTMQDIVARLRSIFPKYNVMVVFPSHKKNVEECAHCSITLKTAEFQIGTVQVYVFKRGFFTLHGDASFINWCYDGNHHKINKVRFGDIPNDSVNG